jgi:hypothetical protein
MAKFHVITRCHVGNLYYEDTIVDLGQAQVDLIKEKKMTHHFVPLDAKDAWAKEAADKKTDFEGKKIEELRAIALDMNIEFEGLKKAELIEAIKAKGT